MIIIDNSVWIVLVIYVILTFTYMNIGIYPLGIRFIFLNQYLTEFPQTKTFLSLWQGFTI